MPSNNRARALAAPAGMGLLMLSLMPGAASAASTENGFNGEGSGTATVTFQGDGGQAEISIDWQGLAPQIPDLSGTPYASLSNMPFPHAQHIHAGGEGRCPTPAEDADGNGVVDTPEGQPAYGPVVTSLTTGDAETGPQHTLAVENFPSGGSADYTRTIDLSQAVDTDGGSVTPADQVRQGKAVIVIHGLNPAIMPGDTALQPSKLNSDFPLAATAPALCGELTESGDGTFTAQLRVTNVVAQQVGQQPAGGVAAGGGSTAASDPASVALSAGLAAAAVAGSAAAGIAIARRRPTS